MTRCLLGIGSNLGDRAAQMTAAVTQIRERNEMSVLAVSDWAETAPVGGPDKQLAYLNGAILLDTDLPARSVLSQLLTIEQSLGRSRETRWGPRSVDLDLLLYGDHVVAEEGLTVPHPWMAIRRFVLEPAETIAADFVHPVIGWSIRRLADNLRARPQAVAIVGLETSAQWEAVQSAGESAGAEVIDALSLLAAAEISPEWVANWRRPEIDSALEKKTSAVFRPTTPVELATVLREAARRRMADASERAAEGKSCQPLLFDHWWWEPYLLGARDDETAGGEIELMDPPVRPTLLVELSKDTSNADLAGAKGSANPFHKGPRLILPADDPPRLEHDLAAALQGMQ